MTTKRISRYPIVDNPPPTFPDVASLGKSRVGRKLYQKAIDRYCIALRRHEGRPALSGPPIRNSEKNGRRAFYTLADCIKGGVSSGFLRSLRAQPRHDHVRKLRALGQTIKAIAAVVGYSERHIRRILHTATRSLAQRWQDAKIRMAVRVQKIAQAGGHEHVTQRGKGCQEGARESRFRVDFLGMPRLPTR